MAINKSIFTSLLGFQNKWSQQESLLHCWHQKLKDFCCPKKARFLPPFVTFSLALRLDSPLHHNLLALEAEEVSSNLVFKKPIACFVNWNWMKIRKFQRNRDSTSTFVRKETWNLPTIVKLDLQGFRDLGCIPWTFDGKWAKILICTAVLDYRKVIPLSQWDGLREILQATQWFSMETTMVSGSDVDFHFESFWYHWTQWPYFSPGSRRTL